MTFDVPEIEDPSIVTGGASEIRTAGENVQQKMRDTSNAWQPISGQYHAPEDGQVHRAMRTPEEMADEIMKSAGKVADGLDAYADKLGPLRTRKTDLEDEIKEYEAAKALADPTDAAAQASLAAWELRLQNKCTKLRIDRDAADSSCASSIRNTTESAGAVIGKKLLGAITRGNNIEGAMGALLQFGKLGTDFVKYYSTYFFYTNGSIKIRQGWAPKLLQDIAKKGKFGKGLVKGLTGWDADAVTNGGQFLAKNSPMNPWPSPIRSVARSRLSSAAACSSLKASIRECRTLTARASPRPSGARLLRARRSHPGSARGSRPRLPRWTRGKPTPRFIRTWARWKRACAQVCPLGALRQAAGPAVRPVRPWVPRSVPSVARLVPWWAVLPAASSAASLAERQVVGLRTR